MNSKDKFYNQVRLRLLKEKRYKDLISVKNQIGLGIGNPNVKELGMYELTVVGRKNKEISMMVELDDKYLGYDVVSAMFYRGYYEVLDSKKYFKVSLLEIEGSYGKYSLISPRLDIKDATEIIYSIESENSDKDKVKRLKFALLVRDKYKFSKIDRYFGSLEDFKDFYKGFGNFRVIEDNLNYGVGLNKDIKKLKEKISSLNKGD